MYPLDGMLVHHRQVTPSITFASTHLYTWAQRGIVRAQCLVQEHNTMSSARAPTQTTQFGDERANHSATCLQCFIPNRKTLGHVAFLLVFEAHNWGLFRTMKGVHFLVYKKLQRALLPFSSCVT